MKALNRNEMKTVNGGNYPQQTCRVTSSGGTIYLYYCSMSTVDCIDNCSATASANGSMCGGCYFTLPY